MSGLFVTLVEKILPFGGPISERNPFHGGCSTTAVPRRLFHDGFIFFLSQAWISNILN
ncbi:MAG: hypothetical protein ACJA0X_002864 [Cyclobacteriaceae bacterium]|jgi:hypothetical protein